MVQRTHTKPDWGKMVRKFFRKFGQSCRELFDLAVEAIAWSWGFFGHMLSVLTFKPMTQFFMWAVKFLHPVPFATLMMAIAGASILFSLHSFGLVGAAFLGLIKVSPWIAYPTGLLVGTLFNMVEIIPILGELFKRYADVLGRSGSLGAATAFDKAGLTSDNFLNWSVHTLEAGRNIGFIGELVATLGYQWLVGGFTKTAIVNGVAVVKPLSFNLMMGSFAWAAAVVFLPEALIRLASAACTVASELHPDAYGR